MWYVYILLCDQKTFYVGITNDIKLCLAEHKNKQSFFTKKFSDLHLVYSESFPNKTQATQIERQFKGWSHIKKEKLINKSLF